MDERKVFLFYNQLTDEEKKSLRIETYSKGEVITTLNKDKMEFFYYVLAGKTKISKNLTDKLINSPFIAPKHYLLGSTIYFGETNLDWDLISISDDLKVIRVPIKIIKRLKKESIDFNNYLYEILMKSVNEYWNITQIKAIYGIRGLIAYILLKNAKRNYIYIENYEEFTANLNISKVTFYKVLSQLIEEKLIIKEEKSIKILDREKLYKIYNEFIV